MSDNGSDAKDERAVTILVNRNEDRGYSIFSVKDDDLDKLMMEVIVPDDMLIAETYRLGGSVAPVTAMQGILSVAFGAIMESFGKLEADVFDEPSDEPPQAD